MSVFSVSGGKTSAQDTKSSVSQYGESFSLELSTDADALSKLQQKNSDDSAVKYGAATEDEKKLSSKAQNYLENLREKYGDYDFVIADNADNPQELTANNTKGHSVILSTQEIERMAEDEEYAAKVMGQVEKAVGVVDKLAEESLENGVQFTSLAVSVDDEGNMKMFASLEKMSEQQRERSEDLKEKRAEEKKETEKAEKDPSEIEEEEEPVSVKRAEVEATSPEELLEKISQIDWASIKADEIEE